MKVRTINELQDKLDNEIQWRKKEIIDYKLIIERNKRSTLIIPLVRGGIALSYAHWEGFVKMSSSIFVSYISTKKIPLDQMKLNFIALSYQKRLNKGNGIEECILLIEDIIKSNQKACKIHDKDIIDTKSNLKFHVLKDILISLGLELSHFESKENFIDKKLVDTRNDIAHGTYRDIVYEDFEIVYNNVIPLMEYYKSLIENSAVQESYKK
ncbi:MAG: MAE_28990/MAE_18760 family HEPN-like nuclease [Reichenbachiella sp.]|uniref:MAE_28990/MAE_18760 family HEPN-like nuclease n=1 Tax=Reichenbachiella sp. TaxID=2184521 RepID=UPI00296698B5|nr:MAE_28990/MAE_18760 family HEPN-like nuclease [Reichenbachiella sp.]MDW3210674.1 MAE_28990/MAE_18760 family HEPN-like nuclease [Reichenbachiella sp.]